jgi:H+/Cl- antiporter ClcA
VEWKEIVSAALLVGALAVLAGFYGWLQIRMLRRLRGSHGLSHDEARWRRGQAWRRLAGSALMLPMAGLLAWAALVMGPRVSQLAAQGPPENNTPENHAFMRLYAVVWIAFLLLLLVLLFIAAVDIWATRRFSIREQRKILDARRDMIQHEVAKMRQDRNGHG